MIYHDGNGSRGGDIMPMRVDVAEPETSGRAYGEDGGDGGEGDR